MQKLNLIQEIHAIKNLKQINIGQYFESIVFTVKNIVKDFSL